MKKLMFILASLCMASCSTMNTCINDDSSRDLATGYHKINKMEREESRAISTLHNVDSESLNNWFY